MMRPSRFFVRQLSFAYVISYKCSRKFAKRFTVFVDRFLQIDVDVVLVLLYESLARKTRTTL